MRRAALIAALLLASCAPPAGAPGPKACSMAVRVYENGAIRVDQYARCTGEQVRRSFALIADYGGAPPAEEAE